MIQKLELKHLAPYLPYGLKVKHFDDERSIKSICDIVHISTDDEVCLINSMYEYYERIEDIKPLLLPLSAFTDEQWIEVFKTGQPFGAGDLHRSKNGATYYAESGGQISYSQNWKHFTASTIFNQLAAFNKIYELHGDLHGLIESGLAINKLDIK